MPAMEHAFILELPVTFSKTDEVIYHLLGNGVHEIKEAASNLTSEHCRKRSSIAGYKRVGP